MTTQQTIVKQHLQKMNEKVESWKERSTIGYQSGYEWALNKLQDNSFRVVSSYKTNYCDDVRSEPGWFDGVWDALYDYVDALEAVAEEKK